MYYMSCGEIMVSRSFSRLLLQAVSQHSPPYPLLSRTRGATLQAAGLCVHCLRQHARTVSYTATWHKAVIDDETLNKPGFQYRDPRDRPVKSNPNTTATASPLDLPVIHVKVTQNNTIFTITDHTGRVLAWTSAGAEGFRNARRGTTFAAQSAGVAAATKALGLGLQKFRVKLKGAGPGRQASLKGLETGGLTIVSLQDVTPIPHNGCKPRKARRL